MRAGLILTVSLTGPFAEGAWSQHAGAIYALSKKAPAKQPVAVTFKARSLSGAKFLSVLRTWGGAKPWNSIPITKEWKTYRVVLTSKFEIETITFSLVPKKGRLQLYTKGSFELAYVECAFAKPDP